MNDLPFTGELFKTAWEEWIQYRKESKFKKYVPTGLKKTFTKLVNDSGNDEAMAIKMIENAMAMAWQGIYPIKEHNGTNQQPFAAVKGGVGSASIKRVEGLRNW